MRALVGLWLLLAGAASAADPIVEIDRVEINGVTVLEGRAVEGALEIGVGEPLDRLKVVRSSENILRLYRDRGYDDVRIRSALRRDAAEGRGGETVLQFFVEEGLATRVSSVRAELVGGGQDPVLKALEARIEAGLVEFENESAGKERLEALRRSVLDALAREAYIGASVIRSEVEPVRAGVPRADDAPPAARWVDVRLTVDPGDQVAFGFRGNSIFTQGRIRDWIEEQRLVGFGPDYVAAIRKRIEDEYLSIGHPLVKVRAFSFSRGAGRRHVTFVIDEGPKTTIEGVEFDGPVVFDSETLRRKMMSLASPLVQKGVFVEKEAERAAALLVEWLKSEGYLAAKLVTINKIQIPKRHRVRLVVYLYEGERTIVRSVTIRHAIALGGSEIRDILGVGEGFAFDLVGFNEGLEALKAVYRARGYLDFRVVNEGEENVVRYASENRLVDIELVLDEGLRYRIGRIDVDGLGRTREAVVRRELTFSEGDLVEEPKLTETESRLRRLGIFAAVTLRTVDIPERPGFKAIRVSVQEGSPGVVGGGLGYRNDLGARAFAQVAYGNVWHRNHTLALNIAGNYRTDEESCINRVKSIVVQALDGSSCYPEYQVELAYIWPWFAFGETTLRPSVTVERTQFLQFDASTTSFLTALERRLLRSTNLVGSFGYSLEYTRQFNAPIAIDNSTERIGALIPSLRLDLRDNSLAPTRGAFFHTSFEWASPVLGSQSFPLGSPSVPVGYFRTQGRADGFVPLGGDVTWYVSFRAGFERNNEPPPANDPNNPYYRIPLIKQFTLGGAGSLRGFKEQELNVGDLAIRGTLSYVNYRTQLDIPFAGPMRFGPFIDAANLLVDQFSFGRLRYGTGVGFHYRSPVGPVNFDLGFKVDPQPGEEPFQFYFSIGVI